MSEQTPAHHTAEHWAQMSRHLEWFTVKGIQDRGDSVQINQSNGWSFLRSKASLGREIRVGERLALETVKLTQITGLRDASGWLFRLTDQDLADEARKFSEDLHRKDVERLERNRRLYAEHETNLPDWLKARIRRFREAAGEKFLLEGWGYELMICRLADLLDRGLEDEADKLARDEGASGNQWDCAKALAAGRKRHGDEFGSALPAGLAPITGSADYS
ncbi:hypothetical protein DAVIS_02627 [Mycobacterium marinum]|uniref:Uncharacterized protein n=1 Tax=Mycobacterium marinum TaxID=1781 RepID=A0A3E2MW51_MYCMR|nr:hypothetical protein [Mycobacterium marinum]RFZ41358.1 hypothetical protein DAVIS_02627 [Mycobacterium marinum]